MIEIRELTKYYDTYCAVNRISFDINRGEILGLLGPNGAGKTTTMRILTCYLKPTAGTIKVKGYDVNDDPMEVKSLIGYLPESAPLYPDMLTYEYLTFIAGVRGLSPERGRERIEELADLCGLREVMHKSIKEISRGYKQRVGLAHAMMSDPEILVLDEPTAGLDPNQIVQIRSIIKQMGKKKTVILSTHILSEAEATCDRIIILNRGKIAADGTPGTIGRAALHGQTLRLTFSGADPVEIKNVLERINGVSAVLAKGPDEAGDVKAEIQCEGDRRKEVYEMIKTKNWILLEFLREQQSLEDTFRELTRESGGFSGEADEAVNAAAKRKEI